MILLCMIRVNLIHGMLLINKHGYVCADTVIPTVVTSDYVIILTMYIRYTTHNL
jgi:hypothetical protein